MKQRYTAVQVHILPGQEMRIHNALKLHKSITIHFSTLNASNTPPGSDKKIGYLCFTPSQVTKIQNATPGTNFSFHFTPAQLKANMKHKGGFIPLLAAFLAPVLGGIIGGVAEKAISGSGLSKKTTGSAIKNSRPLLLHKPRGTLKISSHARGLFLSPYNLQVPSRKVSGLYLAPDPSHRFGTGFQKINNTRGIHLPSSHPCKKLIPHLQILL